MESEHKQQINAVRAVERAEGVTHSQARFALQKATAQAALVRMGKQRVAEREVALAPTAKHTTTEVKIDPTRLPLAPQAGTEQVVAGAAPATVTATYPLAIVAGAVDVDPAFRDADDDDNLRRCTLFVNGVLCTAHFIMDAPVEVTE